MRPVSEMIFLDGYVGVPFTFNTPALFDDPTGIVISQSCNGLFCCRSYMFNKASEIYIYIFNPSTNHCRVLPTYDQQMVNTGFHVTSVSLAFDPINSINYEVVVTWSYGRTKRNGRCKYHITIYSSKTNSWRLSGDVIYAPEYDLSKSGVFWNGLLHWLTIDETQVVYFDFDQESFNTLALPSPPDARRLAYKTKRIKYFGECRGNLYVIQTFGHLLVGCFDILEVKVDYTGWNIKYRVDLEGLTKGYPEISNVSDFSVLYVHEMEEQGSSSKLVLRAGNKVISYDIEDASFKEIQDLQQNLYGVIADKAFPYVESLVCV
ncbi:F-box protein At5g07610-like [Papaver somniferum]|uniref:F-box protein At5g07610-like n=1 Tax=Papaver somniferum TaxID=3469 RepID=UPI000E6FDF45|nr:F-box protein At5g07610-like [Papaver somniferum]